MMNIQEIRRGEKLIKTFSLSRKRGIKKIATIFDDVLDDFRDSRISV